jgi:hypothetical protein
MSEEREEFSVYVFLPEGYNVPVERWVNAETAMRIAKRATVVPGPATRVIVTDGGDCCVFEWRRGEGVIWPRETT